MRLTRFAMVLLIAAIFLFISCSEDSVNSTFNAGTGDNSVTGTVHGIVTTNDTNSPIEGVSIHYISEGTDQETLTDQNGYYICEEMIEGTYTFTFISLDTLYADWMEIITVQSDTSSGNPNAPDYKLSISQNIILYHCNVTLQGEIFLALNGEETVAAEAVPIRLTGMGGVLNAEYSTVTDDHGIYLFQNLPSIPSVTVLAIPGEIVIGENTFEYGIGAQTVALTAGGTVNAPAIILQPASEEIRILGNNFAEGNFVTDHSLTLVFSRPVDANELEIELVDTDNLNMAVPYTYTLSPDGLGLEINPTYNLLTDRTYNLSLSGHGEDFTSFDHTLTFETIKGIQLISSNIFIAHTIGRTDFDVNEAITFTFDREISVDNPWNAVILKDATGSEMLTNINYTVGDTRIEILPDGGPFLGNMSYEVGFLIFSTIAGDTLDTRDNPYAFSTAGVGAEPGRVTGLGLDTRGGFTLDWDSEQILLTWNASPQARFFEVFARNSDVIPNYILLDTLDATRAFGNEFAPLNLPARFDWSSADTVFTPFTNGVQIYVKLRGINEFGHGPFSSEVSFRDTTPPRGYSIDQRRSADNTNGNDGYFVDFVFDPSIEYCRNSDPVWEFRENGGDPAFMMSGGSWQWNAAESFRNGTLSVWINPNTNGSGDFLRMNNVIDNSGNAQVDWVEYVIF
ncbi:MAG: hypothetical protein P9L92_13445 [Candidatus Electryonea clarkiae]|nr:hypothetical protein [Candidatus Electryonea clarkiae]MDP8288906.1 hypothetical protein [Candidatus Electryonea clarkiae]